MGVRDSVGIITNSFICGIQIVAVVYGGRGLLLVFARDEPYDLAIVPSLACHLTDIIAVRDCAAANISHNTAGLMVPNEYVFRKFSGIVAVADRGTAIHRSGNSANIRWNFVGSRSIRHRAIIGAVFDRTASEVTYNAAQISGITGHISGHRYIPDHRVFRGAEQAQTDLILDRRGVIYRHIHALDGMSLSVKGTGVVQGRVYGERPRICDGRPCLHGLAAGAGGIIPVRVKCTVVENDVVRQHSARATVRRLAVGTIDNIPEQLQLVGGADLIGRDCGAEAVHVNGFIADSIGHHNAAIHRAAGHGKFAVVSGADEHTVAAIHRCATFDTAAGHFKAAAAYMYATAGHIGKVSPVSLDRAAVLDFCTAGQGDFSTVRRDKYTTAVQCRAVRNATATFHGENRRIAFRGISAGGYTATGDAVAAGDGRVFGHGKSGVIKIDATAMLCCAVLDHGISRQGDQRAEVRTDTAAATRTAFCAYAIRNESAATHGKGCTIGEANAAAGRCNAAPDTAATHGEIAIKARVHSAAGLSRAANDVAALHDEVYTVGFGRLLRQRLIVTTVHPDAHFFAAGDDTAVDGFCAVFLVQHPQAIGVRRELMHSIGGAVGQRQIADANTVGVFLHFNHRVTIVAGHLQDMAV